MNSADQLSESRRRLLERVLRGEMAREVWDAPIAPRDPDAAVPLAPSQQQIWLHSHMAPDLPFYNETVTVHYRGRLQPEAMERSFQELIRRHEIWRTTFATVDGQVFQVVHPNLIISIPFNDLTCLPADQREATAARLATEDSRRPFDLNIGPLLRARLVKLQEDHYRLHLTLHHIIFDGVSIFRVLVPELAEIYRAFERGQSSPLPPPTLQYGDYALWQSRLLSSPSVGAQIAYWKQQLDGELPVLQLPADRPHSPVPSYRGGMETFSLSSELTDNLKRRSRQERVTPYIFLLATFKALLHRYSGQEDILVGGVTDGRKRAEFQSVMGFFLQTVVLRTRPASSQSFRDYLAAVKDAALGAIANSDVPFDRLVRELTVKRDPSRHPLFQVMFSIEPPAAALDSQWDLTHMEIDSGSSKFDLYFGLDERETGYIGRFIYNTDLFDAPTIQRMIGHWTVLLQTAVSEPETRLGDLPMLTSEEHHGLLRASSGRRAEIPTDTVHGLFEAQALRTPASIAIEYGGQSVTYQELNQKATLVAHHLRQAGAGPATLVAICVERSGDMVAALLGILKSGSAYVPIDPALPRQRIAVMIEDSQAAIILTERHLAAGLAGTAAQIVCCDECFSSRNLPPQAPWPAIEPEKLAYVIYTSGSTGKPKGVEVSHRAVVNLLRSMQREPGFTAADRLLAVTTISFDIAGLELFLPLISGGCVVIASREDARDPVSLMRLMRHSYCSVMQATPATWRALIDSQWPGDWAMKILCGGEALPRDLAEQLLPLGREVWNMYGPTETTIWSTIHRITAESRVVPIGRPIDNTDVFVLDPQRNLLPAGVTGELYIGGAGLAHGYRGRSDLTQHRFVASPFDPAQRLYRTGDLARWLPDGSLECLGRVDNQVKIRGYRIELEEVEAAISLHPEVRQVAVKAWPLQGPGDSGASLAAYVVAASHPDLRRHLQELLPEYMMPARFLFLDALPYTPNGKVDRNALPFPLQAVVPVTEPVRVGPRSAVERRLALIFESVLGIDQCGVHDNFFDLGGHSLLVAKLVRRIDQEFGTRLTMSTVFQSPTIDHLAPLLQEGGHPTFRPRTVSIQPIGSRAPMFWVYGGPFFSSLAARVTPDHPFVNITLDPRDERDMTSGTLPQIAGLLVRKIKALQPCGPYHLGGWCVSGLMAYEVATQLVAAGDQVDLVAIVGSHNPAYYLTFPTWKIRAGKARYILSRLGRLRGRLALDYAWERVKSVFGQMRGPRVPVTNFERVLNAAAVGYAPQAINARVVLIGESERPDVPDLETGWRQVFGRRLEVYEVAGDHIKIFTEAHVDCLAACLNRCLKPESVPIEGRARVAQA